MFALTITAYTQPGQINRERGYVSTWCDTTGCVSDATHVVERNVKGGRRLACDAHVHATACRMLDQAGY